MQYRDRYDGRRNPSRPLTGGQRRPAGRPDPRRRSYSYGARSNPPRRPPSGYGRPSPYRRSANRRQRLMLFLILLACLVTALIYGIRLITTVGVGEPVYINNVYVNDMSFVGYTKEEGITLALEQEEQWRNQRFTLTYLDHRWELARTDVGADIDYESQMELAWNIGHVGNIFERMRVIEGAAKNPIYLQGEITYDESKINAFLDQICSDIDVDAVEPLVVPDENAPVVVQEAQTGLKVDRELLREQVLSLIETGNGDTSVPVETVFPEGTSDDASFQMIAQFSTDITFRNSASRSNVRIALDAFNGVIVNPGERLSFNDIVGPRTEENGFKMATEFAGDTTTLNYGGGICQASSTLYNALTTSGMTIVERHPHSMTVSYVDPSRDAAVEYGTKDLVFQNDSDYPIYIYTSVDTEWATVTIYGHSPEYFYQLETVMITEDVPSTRKVTIEDTEGTYVYYKDDLPVLQSEGKPGCVSQGWVVSYDWETQQEVTRAQVSQDTYRPGASVYYVGVHDRPAMFTPSPY